MPLSKVKARLGQPSESQRSGKLYSLRRHSGLLAVAPVSVAQLSYLGGS